MTSGVNNQTPRLIALDMDGTLLDGDGQIPDDFWPLLEKAQANNISLAPASGRQLATLRDMFDGHDISPRSYIAENGTVVFHDGEVIDTTPMTREAVHQVIDGALEVEVPINIVLCSPECAYCGKHPSDEARQEMGKYYHALEEVDDLNEIADTKTITKVAVLCFDGTEEHVLPALEEQAGNVNIAVSGEIWIDAMDPKGNKGTALRNLAEKLALDDADTAAFGDYLNDYELLAAAGTAVAMDNGHKKLKDLADRIAPPNTEHGVIQVLQEWLGD